jgi:hypothetical protein
VGAEQILADARAAQRLPAGHAKAQRFEALAERARAASDRHLEGAVLLELSDAYSMAAEYHKQPTVFGRLLVLLDQFPDEVGPLSPSIHWQLKWMTGALFSNPDVPLAVTYRWFDELEHRYRQRGYSLRPVHALRSGLALNIGDGDAASAAMEASIAAPRDQMADCRACEHDDFGSWRAGLGDDDGALSYWAPVLGGTLRCREEPHCVLGKAALPLLRAGRADEARRAFLAGYSLARQKISLLRAVGQHVEFCALTGNEARGLEILAEHQGWLADRQVSVSKRLQFLGGVAVLLRRLGALGHDALPVGPAHTVASLAASVEEEISAICRRYDARNGTSAVSERVAARLRQEPLAGRLPLGLPAGTRRRLVSLGGARDLGQPGGEEAPFRLGLREVERPAVGVASLGVAAGAALQLGLGGVEVPVVVEVKAVEDGQAGFWPVDLGHGDGPVHLNHRRACLPGEGLVQRGDLFPVAGLMQVQVGDGGLDQVGAGALARHGPLQQRTALVELPRVPPGAVLEVKRDDHPVAHAGRLARVVQQHQRQQPERFRLVWHQAGERPAEVDGGRGKVHAAAAPALIEDQVHHGEDGREPFG